jgi:hypothetical protein
MATTTDTVLITHPDFRRVTLNDALVTPSGGSQTTVAAHLRTPTFGDVTVTGKLFRSATNGITAHAGGGRSSAVALTTGINRVSTVATDADSVVLPTAAAGLQITVSNAGGHALQVFAAGSDTIDGTAGSTGISLASGKTAIFSSAAATFWHTVLSA